MCFFCDGSAGIFHDGGLYFLYFFGGQFGFFLDDSFIFVPLFHHFLVTGVVFDQDSQDTFYFFLLFSFGKDMLDFFHEEVEVDFIYFMLRGVVGGVIELADGCADSADLFVVFYIFFEVMIFLLCLSELCL